MISLSAESPAADAYLRSLADSDPVETREWIDALDAIVEREGRERAIALLRKLLDHAWRQRVYLPPDLSTPYCNSIPFDVQPTYPGDLEVERRLMAIVRWNALAMVVRANRENADLGGHIASYASAADLFEVGFNHFFRAGQDGDAVYLQPHSAPGVYARAFLEGRLTEVQLGNYRRECGGEGLSSYCHPWLMPGFWQFPTGSMGLGPIQAIYQARFMRYLHNRGINDTANRRVWAFVGDGEMEEPESLAGLSLAGRERLDNLILVVNCNLQRLDGPVRGNGSIIQELEGLFAGAGWNVIKVLWGSEWDPLFARDKEGHILRRLHETVDGEFQTYAATDGQFNREHFFDKYPELKALVADLSDSDIDRLRRGGHDPVKIHAAYHAAVNNRTGRPTVILAKTKKGYGMGSWGQGKMTTHQQKKLDDDALKAFRDRFDLPLSDADVTALRFYRPEESSREMQYLHARRKNLGGYVPSRSSVAAPLQMPGRERFVRAFKGTGDREQSTTTAFMSILTDLLKDPVAGRHIVPIVADEARTFGMQSLFRQIGIYSSVGQLYQPEDHDSLSWYREAKNGQILEEGITEAGAISSWIAAGTSHSVSGTTMLPFYIFYSIFGFQRICDLIWAAADSRARGFLLGATSGRTTLAGEGLQHQDGSSHLIASTVPNCVAYDPCFAYELAVIIENGIQRMWGPRQEDVFYYITLTNEMYRQPPLPDGQEEGILRGMYLLRPSKLGETAPIGHRVQLLGSGAIAREALRAAEILEDEYNVAADVWSVTSFTELARDIMGAERWNRLHPALPSRKAWVHSCLEGHEGPVIAATDYVRAYAEQIRGACDRPYTVLGTDGFGRSDTRDTLRRFFEVNSSHIAAAALKTLSDQGSWPVADLEKAFDRLGIHTDLAAPWER